VLQNEFREADAARLLRVRVADASEKRALWAELSFDEATKDKSAIIGREEVLFTPEQRQRVLIRKISARVSNLDPAHDPLHTPRELLESHLPELAITTLRAIARTKDGGGRPHSFFRSFILAACVDSSEKEAHSAYLQHILRLPSKYVQLKNFSSRGYPDWTLLTYKNLTTVMKYLVDLHDAGGDDAIKNICTQIVPKTQLDILFGGSPGAGGGDDGGELVAAAVPQTGPPQYAAGGYRKSQRFRQKFSRRSSPQFLRRTRRRSTK
jgi:hypothetical protein